MVRFANTLFANTRKAQMEHCPCPKHGMIHGVIHMHDLYNLQVRKKHMKNYQELKFAFQNLPPLNNLKYQNCPKI